MGACLHCGEPVPAKSAGGEQFCCRGCQAAYDVISGLGLESYYRKRCLEEDGLTLKPEDGLRFDFSTYIQTNTDGSQSLHLMVEGIQCAACVWLIESVLKRQAGVQHARINMSTRRLVLTWDPAQSTATALVESVARLGYRFAPFDPTVLSAETRRSEMELLKAMSVAGFAAGNVMLFSVSVWAGYVQGMGEMTRGMMHWLSALIALPALAYAGRPFFRSAIIALKAGRTNMDVPISIGVVLTAGMSLYETATHGHYVYFDSAISLVFFLLVGRYLDSRARARARAVGENLMGLRARAVTVIHADGTREIMPPEKLHPGQVILTAAGERIASDGEIIDGDSDIDTSLINGESVPTTAHVGTRVFAGTLNLSGPLHIKITATGEKTLLSEIVRLMEAAEDARAKYVALADRVARLYAPVVHTLASSAFLGWWILGGLVWQDALMIAVAVLIITCPCALGLAVPAVQVVASGRLLARGQLMKSGTALERLAQIDTVVFDKTGTLTTGHMHWTNARHISPQDAQLAASLAATSTHPLSRALAAALPNVTPAEGVIDTPGFGLSQQGTNGEVRLGRYDWCGGEETDKPHHFDDAELWLAQPGKDPVCFRFQDSLRVDAKDVVAGLKAMGLKILLLSGDRAARVRATAHTLGIDNFEAALKPQDKVARLHALIRDGHTPLMVGDGLNDAPALAAAYVSLSPSTASDISQTTADIVFQGERLLPVIQTIQTARKAGALIKQNFALAFAYNVATVPLAMAGMVTPLIAAIAMSASSLVVIANAMRLAETKTRTPKNTPPAPPRQETTSWTS